MRSKFAAYSANTQGVITTCCTAELTCAVVRSSFRALILSFSPSFCAAKGSEGCHSAGGAGGGGGSLLLLGVVIVRLVGGIRGVFWTVDGAAVNGVAVGDDSDAGC